MCPRRLLVRGKAWELEPLSVTPKLSVHEPPQGLVPDLSQDASDHTHSDRINHKLIHIAFLSLHLGFFL